MTATSTSPASRAHLQDLPRSNAQVIGTLLTRVIVPLWILAGAAFKLYERNPGNLPSVILVNLKDHVDAMVLLRFLIGCELFAIGVMLFLPRFARAMAIFMLSCFVAILIGEMIRGATKCGCFGSLPFKPWHMLLIDGALLLGCIIFPSGLRSASAVGTRSGSSYGGVAIAAIAMLAIGMAIAFAVPEPPRMAQPIAQGDTNSTNTATDTTTQPQQPTATQPDASATPVGTSGNVAELNNATAASANPSPPLAPTVNPNPGALPSSWYTKDMDQWIGKPWRELEIFQLMPTWPKDMDAGKRFVIFYSRTCEHCQAMFNDDLIFPQSAPITAVEIPASKTELTASEGAWAMPPGLTDIEFIALPLGTNWLIQPPMVIAVENGKVTCAKEGEHKSCMGIP